MFKRKKPLTLLQNARELFWPRMGWKRACIYAKHRILRLSDTAKNIALGLSIGVAISFSPILGTHFIQAGIICFLLRANVLAALIATFIGNPWTFPFIWWGGITFGSHLFQLLGMPVSHILDDHITFSMIWDLIKNDPWRLFIPWMLGGYLLGMMSMVITYPIFFKLIHTAQIARRKVKKRKVHNVAQKITGQKE